MKALGFGRVELAGAPGLRKQVAQQGHYGELENEQGYNHSPGFKPRRAMPEVSVTDGEGADDEYGACEVEMGD